jgi:hypothetical protein
MSVEIAVLNALGLIPAVIENEIVAGIEDGVALFRDHTEVASIGISVHDSGFVAAETGFGGISYGPQSFALYVDPSSHRLRMKTRFNAAATTVHELHHCLRQRSCPLRPYDRMCAGDVLILEGLAVHSEEFLGFGAPPNCSGRKRRQGPAAYRSDRPCCERSASKLGVDLREEWPKAWRSVFDGLSHRIIVFVSYAEQPDRGNERSVARCLGRLRFAYGLRGFGPASSGGIRFALMTSREMTHI